ncbi:MAG: ferritin [Gallicola sp.]|nr:ferritin [Gallicola sp.]
MDNKILDQINKQMNFELESAYIYAAMEAWFENEDWGGFAHFMKKQAGEEVEHAQKMIGYLQERGYAVEYDAIPKPKNDYGSIEEIFQAAYDHEKEVTKRCNDIYMAAKEAKDNASEIFMQWYVMEQLEEEATFDAIMTRLERIAGSSSGLYIYNGEMYRRD